MRDKGGVHVMLEPTQSNGIRRKKHNRGKKMSRHKTRSIDIVTVMTRQLALYTQTVPIPYRAAGQTKYKPHITLVPQCSSH